MREYRSLSRKFYGKTFLKYGSSKGSERLREAICKKGLDISNGNFYKNESFSSNAMRLGFASMKENEMVEALGILKNVLH